MVSDCFWKNDRGRGVRGGAAAINNSLYITKHVKTPIKQELKQEWWVTNSWTSAVLPKQVLWLTQQHDLCPLHFSLNLYQYLINKINLNSEKELTFRQVLPSVTQWIRWCNGSISLFVTRKPRIQWVLVKAQCLRQRHQGLVNGLYWHRNWRGC